MSKFKIGDKVRVIVAPEHIPETKGKEGIVVAVRDRVRYPIVVSIDSELYGLSYDEIEHVREDCEERRRDTNIDKQFKVGDKVRVISAPKYMPVMKGMVGTVLAARDYGDYPLTVEIGIERYDFLHSEIEHVRENHEEQRKDANMVIQFKVGDKVRVVDVPDHLLEIMNREGTVYWVDYGNYAPFYVGVIIDSERYILFHHEIEHVHDDSDNGYNRGDRVLVYSLGDYIQCEILSDGFYYAGAKRYVVRSISEDVMRIINENQITETLTNNNN